jgi:hypothetical protein
MTRVCAYIWRQISSAVARVAVAYLIDQQSVVWYQQLHESVARRLYSVRLYRLDHNQDTLPKGELLLHAFHLSCSQECSPGGREASPNDWNDATALLHISLFAPSKEVVSAVSLRICYSSRYVHGNLCVSDFALL